MAQPSMPEKYTKLVDDALSLWYCMTDNAAAVRIGWLETMDVDVQVDGLAYKRIGGDAYVPSPQSIGYRVSMNLTLTDQGAAIVSNVVGDRAPGLPPGVIVLARKSDVERFALVDRNAVQPDRETVAMLGDLSAKVREALKAVSPEERKPDGKLELDLIADDVSWGGVVWPNDAGIQKGDAVEETLVAEEPKKRRARKPSVAPFVATVPAEDPLKPPIVIPTRKQEDSLSLAINSDLALGA